MEDYGKYKEQDRLRTEIEDLEIRIQSLENKAHSEMKMGNPDSESYNNILGWMMEREDCKLKLELLKSIVL